MKYDGKSYRREEGNHGYSFVDGPRNSEEIQVSRSIKDATKDQISSQTSCRRLAKWRRAIESIKSSIFEDVYCRSRTREASLERALPVLKGYLLRFIDEPWKRGS